MTHPPTPPDDLDQVGAAYLTRLTDADLRALVHGEHRGDTETLARIAALRREPALVLDVLDRPATTAGVLNLARSHAAPQGFALISPFLVFAAAIHRLAADHALRDHAEHFHPARRVLNTAADRYLLPISAEWLTAPG